MMEEIRCRRVQCATKCVSVAEGPRDANTAVASAVGATAISVRQPTRDRLAVSELLVVS